MASDRVFFAASPPACGGEGARRAPRRKLFEARLPETSMTTTRRDFLKLTASAAALAGAGGAPALLARQNAAAPRKPGAGKRLLILGGTAFLGPEVVEAAKARGFTITLFNRGKTNPHLFPELEKLQGDRDPRKGEGLKALEGRRWDAVVDTSGQYPRYVDASAGLLASSVRQYVYISSISVYADNSKPGIDETAPVHRLADPTVETMGANFENYGGLKALCEQAAEKAMPGRTTAIRPGLIVGPGDYSDRFTYWPVAPGTPLDPVQVIDVRDLGEWIVRTIEDGTVGVYNATGPRTPLFMREMLEACQAASGAEATLTWVDADFLEKQGVSAWGDMPCWVPPRGESAGFSRVSVAHAVAKGLDFRPIAVTAKDTLAWWNRQPEERRARLRAGIQPEREAAVLKAWHGAKAAK
jgi:2'-hydroxyisoflavone reductase